MYEAILGLHEWTKSLHANEAQLLGVLIGASVTLIAAFIAVKTAFRQMSKQFEHKIIYEGWSDFQNKLFEFSTAFSNYSTTIQWLIYFIISQNNPLVNGNNQTKHRLDKWNEVSDRYSDLQTAYVNFVQSYENHEIIFDSLKKMRGIFLNEFRTRVNDKHMNLTEQIFPEFFGKTMKLNDKELIKLINTYWLNTTEISAFLDDFRRELQNVTVGKILNKTISKRVPLDRKYKILTVNGFEIHK